ncbi:flavodoxin family protein [Ensifer sp. LBL]|uniref:flavodoxin family protein n=1 Tax=Ensifer sp. LBL TaxID=2991056 RepID=UPI003D1FAD24
MKAMVLCSSPRRDGNSATMANAVAEGLREAGHEVETVRADDILSGLLRDCRQCRMPDGECGIDDGFRRAFFGCYLPADGFIAASPIYWYGVSAQLKAFFDRMFCYVAASHPQSASVVAQMTGKRIGLVLSSEETYPTVSSSPQHQFQEFSRYTRSTFVGVVHGHGNARSDIHRDPSDPVARARHFGRTFFSAHTSDYQIDTPRSGRVWA